MITGSLAVETIELQKGGFSNSPIIIGVVVALALFSNTLIDNISLLFIVIGALALGGIIIYVMGRVRPKTYKYYDVSLNFDGIHIELFGLDDNDRIGKERNYRIVRFEDMTQVSFRQYDNYDQKDTEEYYRAVEISWKANEVRYHFYEYLPPNSKNYAETIQFMKTLIKAQVEFREYNRNFQATYFLQDKTDEIEERYHALIDEIGKEKRKK